ncbi:MAG: redoxin domain-containing protein [Rhizobiales bacterium]|nr:redoxin domain-containing protein [Hyphomicrobiales bacterium]
MLESVRFFTRAALSAAGFLVLASASATAAPEVGRPAPAFELLDSAGKAVRLEDYRGRNVILEWSNHDCPYVRKHYNSGNMQDLQRDAVGEGSVWLTVISSAPGTQGYVAGLEADELTASRKAAPTAVLLDPTGKVGRLYDARTTPQMFVISPDGTLTYMGAIDDKPTTRTSDVAGARNYVRDALRSMASGAAPDPAVTRPYGCSVKYGS